MDVNSPSHLLSNPDLVLLGLQAGSSEDAIRAMQARLSAQPGVVRDGPTLLADVLERARLASVCIGDEIALPHARTAGVDRAVLGIARTAREVSFDAEHPHIRLVFLVATPKEAMTELLQLVAAIARMLRTAAAREALLGAPDEAGFRRALAGAARP